MKAGVFLCLFLSAWISGLAQQWEFPATTLKAYDAAIALKLVEARKILSQAGPSPERDYILGLSEALELLITEDDKNFDAYESNFEQRLRERSKGKNPNDQFVEAELHLQWSFVYLKFGKELDAAFSLKNAYEVAEACRKKYPKYIPIRKTAGLLEVMIGSVPEKYNWVLSLLGMKGNVTKGLKYLDEVKTSSSSIRLEAEILSAVLEGFVLQQTPEALNQITRLNEAHPSHTLLSFLGGALAIKNSDSEKALTFLDSLDKSRGGVDIWYANYLKGEVYLHKGAYDRAAESYQIFIDHYKGKNYIKDAHFKIGLCYLLSGDMELSRRKFSDAKNTGKEIVEADRSAGRSLSEEKLPNPKLSRVRYATDGGYYEQARKDLEQITPSDLESKKDKVEFYYRKARLLHKVADSRAAKLFYTQTIEMAGDERWYFAPNSCLQLGYIFLEEHDISSAKKYFNQALKYKKHEYKNSIDSKARSALAQLGRK